MREVLELLEQYRDDVEVEFPPQNIEDIFRLPGSSAVRPSPVPARRRWVAALVAAAVVVALVGGVALLGQLIADEATPVITQPTPTTTVPVTTTTLADTGALSPMAWTRLPGQALLGAGDDSHEYRIEAVVAGGPGLIAVGLVAPVSGQSWGEGAVWVSEDGRAWDRVPDENGVFGGGYAIFDIARTRDGFVAVGAAHDGGQTSGAVWLSSDGLSWSRVESPSFSGTIMHAVTAGDPGLVAVGIGSLWFSVDGIEWTLVETSSKETLWDVAYADWGFVAAGVWASGAILGEDGFLTQTIRPHAWTSPDGSNWERIDLPETAGEWIVASADAVGVVGDTVVVAGNYAETPSSIDAVPSFWSSMNGVEWEHTLFEDVVTPGMGRPRAWIAELVATDSGLVAVGGWSHTPDVGSHPASVSPDSIISRGRAGVWVSIGGTWIEIASDDFTISEIWPWRMTGAVEFGGDLIAVGSYEGQGAVWVGEWTE